MRMLERIAQVSGMRKCMLTVFKSNLAAYQFYEKLGYHIDLISPSQYPDCAQTVDYEILSKKCN